MQEGAGGEPALRGLLSRAGLGGSLPDAARSNEQDSAAPKTKYPSSAKLIEAPLGPDAEPSKPLPPTVFILKTGEKLEANHYTITAGSVHIGEHGNERNIALAALDTKATIAANHERGIEIKIPTQNNQIFLGF
jgi:hypothetical protein